MSRRNAPQHIPDLAALSNLSDFVVDKRQGQRAAAKRHRRNRHYEKQFIRHTLGHLQQPDYAVADQAPLVEQPAHAGQQDDAH